MTATEEPIQYTREREKAGAKAGLCVVAKG